VGTCVGPKGQRVQAIVNELKGENMDIVEWNEDPAIYISNALNPAQVLDVIFDPENSKACTVVVPDYQLSLAIGKRGQNARLAAKLTGHKIDIKSESDMAEFYEQQANQEVAEVAEEMDEAIIHSDMTADDYENLAAEEAVVEAEITEELPEQE
ncbi:transcription termination/antitermination protein NusA, partial [Enterococcus faecalis]